MILNDRFLDLDVPAIVLGALIFEHSDIDVNCVTTKVVVAAIRFAMALKKHNLQGIEARQWQPPYRYIVSSNVYSV